MTSEQIQAVRDSEWYAKALDSRDILHEGRDQGKADVIQTGLAHARKAWTNRFRLAAQYYEASKGAAHAWRVLEFSMAAFQATHNEH